VKERQTPHLAGLHVRKAARGKFSNVRRPGLRGSWDPVSLFQIVDCTLEIEKKHRRCRAASVFGAVSIGMKTARRILKKAYALSPASMWFLCRREEIVA